MKNHKTPYTPAPWEASNGKIANGGRVALRYIEPPKGCDANLRLATAAPELLEALQSLLSEVEALPMGLKLISYYTQKKAQNAVKKALAG